MPGEQLRHEHPVQNGCLHRFNPNRTLVFGPRDFLALSRLRAQRSNQELAGRNRWAGSLLEGTGRNRLPLVGKLYLSACYRAPCVNPPKQLHGCLILAIFRAYCHGGDRIAIPAPIFNSKARDFRSRPAVVGPSDRWPAPATRVARQRCMRQRRTFRGCR